MRGSYSHIFRGGRARQLPTRERRLFAGQGWPIQALSGMEPDEFFVLTGFVGPGDPDRDPAAPASPASSRARRYLAAATFSHWLKLRAYFLSAEPGATQGTAPDCDGLLPASWGGVCLGIGWICVFKKCRPDLSEAEHAAVAGDHDAVWAAYLFPVGFFASIAGGLVIGVASSLYLRHNWRYAALHVCGWLSMGYLIHRGKYREAVYWSLCCVYCIAAFNFQRRLARNRTGNAGDCYGLCDLVLSPSAASVDCAIPLLCGYRVAHLEHAEVSDLDRHDSGDAEEQVSSNEWLALHDELTGLPNRRLFADRLTTANRAGETDAEPSGFADPGYEWVQDHQRHDGTPGGGPGVA